jgi:uncharacterized repeat protein (TIGR03806 family)
MRRLLKIVSLIAMPLAVMLYTVGCNSKPGKIALDVTKAPFKTLSEYNFFVGALNELKPNERLLPYDLNSSLFTDYAFKARFVFIPEGKSTEYDTTESLKFPVGTCLIKNFYYPDDFKKQEGKRRIIETRLLIHRESGWDALGYVWNDEQTDAELKNAGDIKEISWLHYDGTKRTADYIVPTKSQCKGCHWFDNAIRPIGPKIRNLNKDYNYEAGKANQLEKWVSMGLLTNLPAVASCPTLPDWQDSVKYTLNERARAYLEINCGHCHNPKGPAYTSGFYVDWLSKDPSALGICKSPVAAGKATGGRLFTIKPGSPQESIAVFRMESDDPSIRMPELGKQLIHTEGVVLIRQWIAAMPDNACEM